MTNHRGRGHPAPCCRSQREQRKPQGMCHDDPRDGQNTPPRAQQQWRDSPRLRGEGWPHKDGLASPSPGTQQSAVTE